MAWPSVAGPKSTPPDGAFVLGLVSAADESALFTAAVEDRAEPLYSLVLRLRSGTFGDEDCSVEDTLAVGDVRLAAGPRPTVVAVWPVSVVASPTEADPPEDAPGEDVAPPWSASEDAPPDSALSAWATPEPFATARPRPNATAPAPNHP